MYVKNLLVTALYRVVIGLTSGFLLWVDFGQYGTAAWENFATWALVLVAIYYIMSGILTFVLHKRQEPGWTMTPTWQLASLIALWLVFADKILGLALPGQSMSGSLEMIVSVVLPILVLADWLFFSKKGQFRLIDPWYALALPTCYLAIYLLSADNFTQINAMTLICWVVVRWTVILLGGYVVFVADFALSGKLSQCIVMPKIKVIEIPEPETEETKKAPEVVTAATEEGTATVKKSVSTKKPAKDDAPKAQPAPAPEAPKQPSEPAQPTVPQIENRKKDHKSAQNLHSANQH